MNKLEAKKILNLLRKSTFKDVVLRGFYDEMIGLIDSDNYEPLIYNKGKRMITLRVNELSIGLFHDNTLGMMRGNGEMELTMIPVYLFREVSGLFSE